MAEKRFSGSESPELPGITRGIRTKTLAIAFWRSGDRRSGTLSLNAAVQGALARPVEDDASKALIVDLTYPLLDPRVRYR